MTDLSPFFGREPTRQAIETLAASDSLSLFLGAGVSAESALPPWHTLIERILRKVAERLQIDPGDIPRFVHALIEQHGLLTAAAIAQSYLGPRLMRESVRAALYEEVHYEPRPGFHSEVIADFVVHELAEGREQFRVVTTNYDRLIETALEERFAVYREKHPDEPARSPVSVTSERDILADQFPVYHIHGCVGPGEGRSGRLFVDDSDRIVLGERDYAQLQTGARNWQDKMVGDLLEAPGMCLFTGMSLADPNIIRYLTSSPSGERNRYALFCRQSKRVENLPPVVVQKYDEVVRRRVSDLNVVSITADYYTQVPQFMSEVLLCRSQDGWPTGDLLYENRLRRWRESFESAVHLKPDSRFQADQRILGNKLAKVLDGTRRLIVDDYVDIDSEERLAIELWYRNPGPARSLELWGSSAQMWSSYDDLMKPRISYESEFTAVQTLMLGGSQFRLNGRPGSRWKYQLSLPIRLPDEPWFNLPVGCVVLSSSAQQHDSCLDKLRGSTRRDLEQLVLDTGTELCDPNKLRALIEGESA